MCVDAKRNAMAGASATNLDLNAQLSAGALAKTDLIHKTYQYLKRKISISQKIYTFLFLAAILEI